MRARDLARASALEIERALVANAASAPLRVVIGAYARVASVRLGRSLARFDDAIATRGLAAAARTLLADRGARVTVTGAPPTGPALVVANHPGAYDALALMSAFGRDDVMFLAHDRDFLRAFPNLGAHLAIAGVGGVKRLLRHIARGGVGVQLGAGAIEPEGAVRASWPAGTGFLAVRAAKAGASVVPCFVDGVHSARAKRLPFVRWAERHGVSTLAPLVQATTPGFRDVRVAVRFGAAVDATQLRTTVDHSRRAELLRRAVGALRG